MIMLTCSSERISNVWLNGQDVWLNKSYRNEEFLCSPKMAEFICTFFSTLRIVIKLELNSAVNESMNSVGIIQRIILQNYATHVPTRIIIR